MPQQYDPNSPTPYVAPELPQVQAPQPSPLPAPSSQGFPIAPSKVGGIASIADNVMRGFMQGRAMAQESNAKREDATTKALQASYNLSAQNLQKIVESNNLDQNQLQTILKGGVPTGDVSQATIDSVKQANQAVQGSWQAWTTWLGQHIEGQQGKKKGGKKGEEQQQGGFLQRLASGISGKDPAAVSKAIYDFYKQNGPPIYSSLASVTANAKQRAESLKAESTQAQAATAQAQGTADIEKLKSRERELMLKEKRTPEEDAELERTRNAIEQTAATSGTWEAGTVTIDGKKVTVMHDKKTNRFETPSGEPVDAAVLNTFAPASRATQQGFKLDKNGQVVDLSTGKRYSKEDKDNPEEVQKMFKSADDTLEANHNFQLKLASMRGATYNSTRPISSFDSWNGNAPTEVTFGAYSQYPGRYLPAGPADKAIARENLMQDISGTSKLTRDAIDNLKEDFPESMKVKIALAMKADDPHAALDNLISSGALGSLNDDQQDFLIATRQLAENAMAMRSILGAGQGSEDMRNAIRDTLPTLLSPDRKYALRQLDAFDKTIARLHRGVPKVPLNEEPFGPQATPKPKGSRSLKAAMDLPANKGKTEDEVIKDLEKHNYTVTRP